MSASVRTFDTGATRDLDATKPDYEGFLSPLVIRRYGEYMHRNRTLPDGSMRDSDNWQAGIPLKVYAKSFWRHALDFWCAHRGVPIADSIEDALCAVLFNASGYLHEVLKAKSVAQLSPAEIYEAHREALEARSTDELALNAGGDA